MALTLRVQFTQLEVEHIHVARYSGLSLGCLASTCFELCPRRLPSGWWFEKTISHWRGSTLILLAGHQEAECASSVRRAQQ